MNPIHAAQAAADDAISNGGVTADFSAETWWLTVIKAGFIVAFLIVSVMMAAVGGAARPGPHADPPGPQRQRPPSACSRRSPTPASSS